MFINIVIHFTFTAPWGTETSKGRFPVEELRKEIMRIRSYWLSHGNGIGIGEVIVAGKRADAVIVQFSQIGVELGLAFSLANVWLNALDLNRGIPPVSMSDSLGYGVAAGLAFETPRNS